MVTVTESTIGSIDLRCICTWTHCCGRCHNRATQEDRRCDGCRGPSAQIEHGIVHVGQRYGTGAQAATPGPWVPDGFHGPNYDRVAPEGEYGAVAYDIGRPENAVHIARQDPAATLARVAALRKMIDYHYPVSFGRVVARQCAPIARRVSTNRTGPVPTSSCSPQSGVNTRITCR